MTNTDYPPQQNQPQPPPQQMVPSTLPLTVWGATDKGRQREGNEDSIYPHSGSDTFPFKPSPDSLSQKGQLLVVADGVGGAKGGAEASRWVTRVVVERYYDLPGPDPGADLQTAIGMANTSLYQYLQSTGALESGSTMVAAVIHGDTLQVANVGDSRAYLIRNGQITQLTRDHTLTQQKIDRGMIQPDQAATDPDSSVLTRSMGAGPTVQADLFQPIPLNLGDVVLLCSDGLTGMLSNEEIVRLANGNPPKRAAQRLIAAANKNGGFDNISVVIAQVGGKTSQPAGGEFLGSIARMKREQKIILTGMAALVGMVFCLLLSWAAWAALGSQKDPTPTIAPTETPAAATTVPVVAPDTSPTTVAPTSGSLPTSTPKPTDTPTPTPLPDLDRDGVIDQHDECINTPGLREFNGCPDNDGDTIPEREDGSGDECPNWSGLPQFNGCPDDDEDNVPEREDGSGDQCPNASGPVENLGCPDFGGDGGGGGGGGEKPIPTNPPPPP